MKKSVRMRELVYIYMRDKKIKDLDAHELFQWATEKKHWKVPAGYDFALFWKDYRAAMSNKIPDRKGRPIREFYNFSKKGKIRWSRTEDPVSHASYMEFVIGLNKGARADAISGKYHEDHLNEILKAACKPPLKLVWDFTDATDEPEQAAG